MKRVMLLAIGDELLSGIRKDTNCSGLAWSFHNAGWKVVSIEVVPDTQAVIVESLQRWVGKVDIIVISGGLGPTHDDRTRFAIADYLECKLKTDDVAYDIIASRYKQPLLEWIERSRSMQALIPIEAKSIHNPAGSGLGIFFERKGTSVYVFPGVPVEFVAMAEQELGEMLVASGNWTSVAIVGIPESAIKERLSDLTVDSSLHISILPSFGQVEFVIRGVPSDIAIAEARVRELFPNDCLPKGILKLPEALVSEAVSKGKTLAFAESCTGGLVAAAVTEVPGASKVLLGSAVTYSNESKESLLGVLPETLHEYGAVSAECAHEMALGALAAYRADYAVSITGIAGPDGGSQGKPVGLVWFALASAKGARSFHRHINGNRQMIRERARTIALETIWRELREVKPQH